MVEEERHTNEFSLTFSTSLAASTSTTPSIRAGTFADKTGLGAATTGAGRDAAKAAAMDVILGAEKVDGSYEII